MTRGYAYQISKEMSNHPNQPFGVICQDTRDAYMLHKEISFFEEKNAKRIVILPDWETLAYDPLSAQNKIISDRLHALYRLLTIPNPILITTLSAASSYICPIEYIKNNCLLLQVGDKMTPTLFRQQMQILGAIETHEVHNVGEFSVRGGILDIYTAGGKEAFRIELFDDEVDSIRTINIATQRSEDPIDKINILPSQEFMFDTKTCQNLQQKIQQYLDPKHHNHPYIKNLQQKKIIAGIQYYLPLLHEKMVTIKDYMKPDTTWYLQETSRTLLEERYQQAEKKYENLYLSRPTIKPDTLFLTPTNWDTMCNDFTIRDTSTTHNKAIVALPDVRITQQGNHPTENLTKLYQQGFVLNILTPDKSRLANLAQSLHAHGFTYKDNDPKIRIQHGELREGFLNLDTKEAFISEQNLIIHAYQNHEETTQSATTLPSTDDWKPGMYLVHRDYGVGAFQAFTSIERDGINSDYLVLEYADQATLYVSINQLHLVEKYIGQKSKTMQLDQLGSKKWSLKKKKAEKACDDLAAKLLESHVLQKGQGAPECKVNKDDYALFCEAFPYDTTHDQQQCINHVLHDLEKNQSMDRLICGDVGFGKTEVAIRAAYVVAQAGYQVALLTPTTLLANQHLQTFQQRFSSEAHHIVMLSRLTQGKDCQAHLAGIENGQVDIVIATHKLLSKSLNFKNLGLIIIDEEHRFGVKQKEMIHAIKKKAHIMSLSATPIPRTLHMAMSNIRDMSIIATPPPNRRAIATYVKTHSDAILLEAIQRELQRGGQIYYVHNNIGQHEKIKSKIQKMIPTCRCASIHGQLQKNKIATTMVEFANHYYDLLICSTIIESGIDIANANTIIIHRADLFGLSQIHQLKGRVGRSYHQGYAYMLIPEESLITPDAKRRIESIQTHKHLGAGFNLASEDLEIRGAGDLLGSKQSGHLTQIGLDMYSKLLKKATLAIENPNHNIEQDIEIETSIPMSIPEHYIQDTICRLQYYRKIRKAESKQDILHIQNELQDRFGLIPPSAMRLITLGKIQSCMIKNSIIQANITRKSTTIIYAKQAQPNPAQLIQLSSQVKMRIHFLINHTIKILAPEPYNDDKTLENILFLMEKTSI